MSLNPGTCRGCGRPILWAKTVNNKAMPLDAEPAESGNIVVHEDGCVRVIPASEKGRVPGPYYVSHYATCPHGAQFRRKP